MPLPGMPINARVKLGRNADDCWTWLGPTTPDGHGKLTFCGRDSLAHRWIWEQLFGPIPEGFIVYSACGTKGCPNPHHLALGTQADANRGSVQTRLLPSDVREIRGARKTATHHTASLLAERYGVSANTIRGIWRGKTWGKPRSNPGPRRNVENSGEVA